MILDISICSFSKWDLILNSCTLNKADCLSLCGWATFNQLKGSRCGGIEAGNSRCDSSWGKIPLQLWTYEIKQSLCFQNTRVRQTQNRYSHCKWEKLEGWRGHESQRVWNLWANSTRFFKRQIPLGLKAEESSSLVQCPFLRVHMVTLLPLWFLHFQSCSHHAVIHNLIPPA